MLIKYLGHACFLIGDKTKKIVIDPFGDIGYKQECVTADYCFCSHSHYDHHSTDCVTVREIFDENCKTSFDWVKTINSFHDEVCGQKRGKNNIYVFNFDKVTVCHMGDLGVPFSKELVEQIGKIDVLLIPIGGNYTIDSLNAKKYVEAIAPAIVIPMHYKTKRSDIDIDGKELFIKHFNCIAKQRQFEIKKSDLTDAVVVYDIDDSDF